MMDIPFNRPYLTGREMDYISSVLGGRRFAGDGAFSKKCARWLEERTGCRKAILVPSGTAALEMMMILAGIGPGDEVILPSFTFSSTANAVALRGAVPVFVDIRPDTLNMDETKVEAAVTARTRAIVPVHYAGVACHMDAISAIAHRHGLLVLEDAAQGILASYRGRPLGTLGHMGALSFHETKNVQCGEGGALLIGDPSFAERAEIVMEKGTDRSRFLRGQVDKYTWVDLGSSFLMNEITAAFLFAQLEAADAIVGRRLELWEAYHSELEGAERAGILRRPVVPPECGHNAHIYYILFPDGERRDAAAAFLRKEDVQTASHYIPLESSRAGRHFGRSVPGSLAVSESCSSRLLRLPLFPELEDVRKVTALLRG